MAVIPDKVLARAVEALGSGKPGTWAALLALPGIRAALPEALRAE